MNTKNKTNRGGSSAPWTTTVLSAGILAASSFAALTAFAQAPTNPPGIDPSGRPIGPDSTRPGPPSSRLPGAANPGAPGTTGNNANRATRPNSGATFSGTVPSRAGASSLGTANLAGAMRRAAAMRQAARVRAQSAPLQARASYRAAEASLSGIPSGYSTTNNGGDFLLSAPQAAGDIRTIQSAARRARQSGQTREASRLRTLATRYATGARAFFTGELREALFAPATLPSVVIRGDSRAAANARATAATTSRRRGGRAAGQGDSSGAAATPLPAAPSGPTFVPTPPPVVVSPSNGPVVVGPNAPGAPPTPPVIIQDPGGAPDVVVPPPVVPPAPPPLNP